MNRLTKESVPVGTCNVFGEPRPITPCHACGYLPPYTRHSKRADGFDRAVTAIGPALRAMLNKETT